MIKIPFEEPGAEENSDWSGWRDTCAIAQKALNDAHAGRKTRPAVRPDIYSGANFGIKGRYYFGADSPFRGKCAYCEQQIAVPRSQPGDLDHFRPHGAVCDIENKKIYDGEEKHPGYYWLAYDWRNLLPCCASCNGLVREADGTLIGKGARFPVVGNHATSPGEEVDEDALLLHPVFDDPLKHLKLDENGTFHKLTARGEACLKVFGLNLRGLPDARKQVYEGFKNKVGLLVRALHVDPEGKEARDLLPQIKDILDGKMAHTSAALKARKDSRDILLSTIQLFGMNSG